MRVASSAAAATIGCALLLAQAATARAADIQVILAGGLGPVVTELRPGFEAATGHKLNVKFVSGPVVRREVDAGEPFDVAISQPNVIDDLIKAGKIEAGTRADIARAGVGVSVRVGAAKPDIGSVDAFKRALLGAKTVAHSKEGASGVYFMGLLDRLGIAAEMKPKLVASPAGAGGLVSPVVKGEAEMVVGTTSAIMEPGVELVGPIPEELQSWAVFTAGVGTAAKEPDAAKALVAFLTAPGAVATIKAKGMEPLAR